MKVIRAKPPIYDACAARFGEAVVARALFCWGDAIYDPSSAGVNKYLQAHERVHRGQQEAVGGPEVWWERYLASDEFRLNQEVEAYAGQYRAFCKDIRSPIRREACLQQIAEQLSSPLYGSLVGPATARTLILRGAL